MPLFRIQFSCDKGHIIDGIHSAVFYRCVAFYMCVEWQIYFDFYKRVIVGPKYLILSNIGVLCALYNAIDISVQIA